MNESESITSFLQSLSSHERWLAGYVHTLIPNAADAEDVLQEVKLALWENFSQFEPGTSFAAWSKQVAYYRALAYRQKKAIENKRLTFSEECFEILEEHYSDHPQTISEQTKRLSKCLAKLPAKWQTMIALRYKEEFSIKEIALRFELTEAACYKTMSRIRLNLKKCLTAS